MASSNWVPDENGLGCAVCHHLFTVTRRRHHCRKCGSLVCGTCSDNFAILPELDSERAVRICDNCELKASRGFSEEMDVNDQIAVSLKESLKEKSKELELFRALLAHSSCSSLQELVPKVHDLCAHIQQLSVQYNSLRMDHNELERDIRYVGQKCLRAESIVREGESLSSEIEKLSRLIGTQDRQIIQLQERLDRLNNPTNTPPHSIRSRMMSPRSPSPPPRNRSADMIVISAEVRRPTVKSILKALTKI